MKFRLSAILALILAGSLPLAAQDTEATSEPTFPIRITHSLGTVEIPAQPERVMTLSMGDTDVAYALGFTPVAISQNDYSEDGLYPWLADLYDPEQTEIIPNTDISFESLVALQPDIILSGSRWNVEDLYPNLAEIAPTTAWLTGSYENSWQEQTLLAGQALGLEAEAQALIDETEAEIAAIREEFPAIEGKSFSLSFLYDVGAIASIYWQEDFGVQFFQELGFEVAPALAELAAGEDELQGALSFETLNLIDADLVVLAFSSPEIQASFEENPVYQQLDAVREGRVVVVDTSTITQLRSPSVLGIRYVLDQLRPALETLSE